MTRFRLLSTFLLSTCVLTAALPARPEVTATLLPVGTALRAWCAVRGNTVYFTEKTPRPAGFRPGTVYRTLHAVTAGASDSRPLLVIGHTRSNPLLDPARGVLYALRRVRDTNGNGLVDPADRAELWRLDTKTGKMEKMAAALPPLAVSRDRGELVVGDTQRLLLIPARGKRAVRLPAVPDGPRLVRYDNRDRLVVTSRTGRYYRLEDGAFRPTTELDMLADGTRIRLVAGVPALILPGSPVRPFPLAADGVRFSLLYRIPRSGVLVLLRHGQTRALLAAEPATGRWTPLYAFPADTTFHALDADGGQIALLTTRDSDGDKTLNPAGLDRSALTLLRIR